jgi:hypothetical protein
MIKTADTSRAKTPGELGSSAGKAPALKRTLLELLRGGEIDSARTIVKSRLLLWCGGIVAALLQTWAFRHDSAPDGISYLDIANQCVQGNWHSLVNGYWSPLYPFLLSLGLRLLRPSPYWESTVAHFVNFGIFVLSFVCFEIFLKALIQNQRRCNSDTGGDAIPEWAMWVLGDSLFVWATLLLIHLQRLLPDLCVAALVYLAAAEVLRIWAGKSGWFGYARFGGILGIAYLAKAVMFPLAFVFLGCALFAARPIRQTIPRAALALAVFVLVGAPFMTALYKQKGRVTYGDVGMIAYAEFVNGASRYIHWQGGPPGTGMPVHATRMLRAEPPVFEFGTPIQGTYPPWYDPSYWYEGVSNKFILRNQLSAVYYTIEESVGILPYMAGLFVGFLGMALFAQAHGYSWRNLVSYWPIWVPAAAALGIYSLVYVEARFVVPFFALIWLALFAGLRFPQSQTARALVASLALAIALTSCAGISWLAGRALFRTLHPKPFVNWEVAQGLEKLGIRPGEEVGSIGSGLDAYWAHLAGVRIVVEVPIWGSPRFWSSDAKSQSEVFADFAEAGARIVVSDQRPPMISSEGWQEIGATGYFVHPVGSVTSKQESK